MKDWNVLPLSFVQLWITCSGHIAFGGSKKWRGHLRFICSTGVPDPGYTTPLQPGHYSVGVKPRECPAFLVL